MKNLLGVYFYRNKDRKINEKLWEQFTRYTRKDLILILNFPSVLWLFLPSIK